MQRNQGTLKHELVVSFDGHRESIDDTRQYFEHFRNAIVLQRLVGELTQTATPTASGYDSLWVITTKALTS